MSVAVGYEWKIHYHLDCYMSLDGVSVPIKVTGCCLSPLGCTRQDLSIQEGHQFCWFMFLLHCSGHIDIVNQKHTWCLTDIWHWWKHCMLTDCQEGTHFHQCCLMLHQPGLYLPHALYYHCVCCVIKVISFYLWWDLSARTTMTRSDRTWAHQRGGNTILWWGCPP